MKTIERTPSKARTARKSALETPAIRKGIVAAYAALLDGKENIQNLADFLTPSQLGKLDREAKSEGFKGAVDFVEKFMESALLNLIAEVGGAA